jgi:ABC-type nitrate/sulfonate/bicarbonate transport system substrate-binding protein
MTRSRQFNLFIALLMVFGLIAAACGDDDDAAPSDDAAASEDASASSGDGAAAETETVTLQLDWVPNTNHTGFFVADEMGYYAEEGIEFEVLPYSGGNGDTIVAEGQAEFAISFQNSITLARPAGVPVKAVAAVVQHTAEAIAVRADATDISSPKDLDGKLYAGFGGPFEVPVMTAIIQTDGGQGEFESVVLDTAAYEAVYNGSADFVIPFKTWEGVEAELNNEPLKYFEYADYGVPDSYSVLIIAADDWLADNGDIADRFLRATKKGFEFAAENPQEAGQILIDANPGVFNEPELVFQSAELMANEYYLDDAGAWGTIDPDQFAGYAGFLFDAGIVVDEGGNPLEAEPDWTEFFDTSHLG